MSRQPIANLLFVLALSAGLAGCAHRLPAAERVPSFAVAATDDTPLARIASRELAGSPADHSALHLLRGGKEALAARLALIERAQRSVDVQYYIWRADASGQLMATALRRAAERGVRVRLLLDDWGSRPTEAELGLLAAHPNVEVRLFNPLPLRWALTLGMLLDFERGNRRMHNKALVADNQAAIVGDRRWRGALRVPALPGGAAGGWGRALRAQARCGRAGEEGGKARFLGASRGSSAASTRSPGGWSASSMLPAHRASRGSKRTPRAHAATSKSPVSARCASSGSGSRGCCRSSRCSSARRDDARVAFVAVA